MADPDLTGIEPSGRVIPGEAERTTDMLKPVEHPETDQDRRRVIELRNRISGTIRREWDESKLRRVARILEE